MTRFLLFASAAFALLSIAGIATSAPRADRATGKVRVTQIIDGDTLKVQPGGKIRLIQIDTPELRPSECFGTQAKLRLEQLAPVGSQIRLTRDPKLDNRDSYGRWLRYAFRSSTNLNVSLVRSGHAAPYYYRGEYGVYRTALDRAFRSAQSRKAGAWRSCSPSKDTTKGWSTGSKPPATSPQPTPTNPSGTCQGNPYPCAPAFPPDVDCSQLPGPVWVGTSSDPHRLDNDGDGIGCE